MTKQEILIKAIEKAVTGGWLGLSGNVRITEGFVKNKGYYNYEIENHSFGSIEAIIFNQDFARALWGEEVSPEASIAMYSQRVKEWQWHLMCLAIADNPIKYLEASL